MVVQYRGRAVAREALGIVPRIHKEGFPLYELLAVRELADEEHP